MALSLVRWARDHAQVADLGSIELGSVERAMLALGIDEEGLDDDDRRILAVLLGRGRPMGIDTIAATLRMDSKTIRRVHEPYLLEQGYMVRTYRRARGDGEGAESHRGVGLFIEGEPARPLFGPPSAGLGRPRLGGGAGRTMVQRKPGQSR